MIVPKPYGISYSFRKFIFAGVGIRGCSIDGLQKYSNIKDKAKRKVS